MRSSTAGRSRPALGLVLVATLLAVAGCSGSTNSGGTEAANAAASTVAPGGAADDADGTGSGKALTAGDPNQPECQGLQRFLLEEMSVDAAAEGEEAAAGDALAAAVPAAKPVWDQIVTAIDRMDGGEVSDDELQTVTAQALIDIQSVDDLSYETCGIPFWSSLEMAASLQDDGACSDFAVVGDAAHDTANPCPPIDQPDSLPCFAPFGEATRDQPGSYQPVDCGTGELAGWSPTDGAWVAI
ncbi:MAG: hypothetical protein ACK5RL_15660 [Acidimicrobiales bacterium]